MSGASTAEQAQPETPDVQPLMHGVPMLQLSKDAQEAIIMQCNTYKKAVVEYCKQKKQTQQRCYFYYQGRFFGDDLLPRPATNGSENNSTSNRPEIFMPLTRQQVKLLFSGIKISIFPNDEDYFRIRSKSDEGVQAEEALTEGIKYILKDKKISEKIGQFLLDLIVFGQAVAFPCIKTHTDWEWRIDPQSQQYIPMPIEGKPEIALEIWNPLNFYPDPMGTDADRSKWGYFTVRKKQDIEDTAGFMNLDQLEGMGSASVRDVQDRGQGQFTLSDSNQLNGQFADNEKHIIVDHYYFPHIEIDGKVYRNMLFVVAEERVLIDARPNLLPSGKNPVVFTEWAKDKDSPCGTGPVEDISHIQRLTNILWNYQIETFARIGNRFMVREGVDMSQFWGVAGGVATCEDPRNDVVPMTGDYIETQHMQNMIGVLKAEATQVSGAQNPFQGSSNIDFKKTATEIQLLQENGSTLNRELVEHICITGVEPILNRLMMLIANDYDTPLTIKVKGQDGMPHPVNVNFDILKSGQYSLEMVSTNGAQSKQAQIEALSQFLQIAGSNPEILIVADPIIRKMGTLWGLKDTDALLNEVKQNMQQYQGYMQYVATIQQAQQGIQGSEAGSGAMQQSVMG